MDKFALLALLADPQPTGIGVYSIELVRELACLLRGDVEIWTAYPPAFSGAADRTLQRGSVTELSSEEMPHRGVVGERPASEHCLGAAATILEAPEGTQPRFGPRAAMYRFLWMQTSGRGRAKDRFVYCTSHHGPPAQRLALTIHDLAPLHFPTRYRLQSLYFKVVLPGLVKRASHLFADSEAIRQEICGRFGVALEKVSIASPAVNATEFAPPSEAFSGRPFLLMVGASYPHKNLEVGLEALARWRPGRDAACVIVGGREAYLEILRRKAKELGISDRVEIRPYAGRAELARLYQTAFALVYPSLYEGFGLPPLEAMACGCPVIASNTGAVAEVCGDAAVLVPPTDSGAILHALERLESGQRRQTWIARGAERVRLYSWRKSAQVVASVLQPGAARAAASA